MYSYLAIPKGHLASENPLSIRETQGFSHDLPGEGARSLEPHTYAAQGGLASSFGLPLVSTGFSRCWAAIIYDHETCRSFMLHCDDLYFNGDQKIELDRLLKPSGKRSAVVVYGDRSHAGRHREQLANYNCHNVRDIAINPDRYHWGLAYHPERNVIEVAIRNPERILTFPGVSPLSYDLLDRAGLASEIARERSLSAVRNQSHCNPWAEYAGYFSSDERRIFFENLDRCYPDAIPKQGWLDFILAEKIGFIKGDRLVLPDAMHYANAPDAYGRFNLRLHVENALTLNFHNYKDIKKLYSQLVVEFKNDLISVDQSYLHLRDKEKGAEVLVGHALRKLHINGFQAERTELLDRVFDAARHFCEEGDLRFRTEIGSYTFDHKIPPREQLIELEKHSKEYREIESRRRSRRL